MKQLYKISYTKQVDKDTTSYGIVYIGAFSQTEAIILFRQTFQDVGVIDSIDLLSTKLILE